MLALHSWHRRPQPLKQPTTSRFPPPLSIQANRERLQEQMKTASPQEQARIQRVLRRIKDVEQAAQKMKRDQK